MTQISLYHQLEQALGGIPEFVLTYQFRTKRVVSMRLARKRPQYFDRKLVPIAEREAFNFHGMSYTTAGKAEREYWRKHFVLAGSEVNKIYVNMHGLHVTIKLVKLEDRPKENLNYRDEPERVLRTWEECQKPLIYPETGRLRIS